MDKYNVIWKGKLEKERVKFNAEIIDYDGVPRIIERNGLSVKEVSVHEINPEGLLDIIYKTNVVE